MCVNIFILRAHLAVYFLAVSFGPSSCLYKFAHLSPTDGSYPPIRAVVMKASVHLRATLVSHKPCLHLCRFPFLFIYLLVCKMQTAHSFLLCSCLSAKLIIIFPHSLYQETCTAFPEDSNINTDLKSHPLQLSEIF